MMHFPSDLLENLRLELEDEKTRVSSRIAELIKQDPFSDSSRTDDNAATDAEANEESSHDRFTALVEQLAVQLADINGALGRIGKGSFGICTNCGQMIDTDRLSILPTATLCLRCEKLKKK
jgi:RNA polymerase-binding transcription factor DksA